MSVERKLVSNIAFLFLDWFFLTVFSFTFWLVIGKTLPPSEYGIISTFIYFTLFLSSVTPIGFSFAVSKLIPEYIEKKKMGNVKKLIYFSLNTVFLSSITLTLLLFAFSFSPNLTETLKMSQNTIWLLSLSVLIYSFNIISGSIVYGFQKMKNYMFANLFGGAMKAFGSIFLIFIGFGFFGPLIGFILAASISALYKFKIFLSDIKSVKSLGKIKFSEIMSRYALPAFISLFAWTIFTNTHYIILTIIKNPGATGLFAVAMLLTSQISVIFNSITTGFFPVISAVSSRRNTKTKQKYLTTMVLRYGIFITIPIALFLGFFSEEIILIFSDSEYLIASSLFPMLLLAAVIFGPANLFLSTLYAIGKTKLNRNITVLVAIIFLFLSITLTYYFSSKFYTIIWPAIGLSIAYFISVSLMLILSFRYLRKFIKINTQKIMLKKISIASIITFLFLYFISPFTHRIFLALFVGFISFLLYCGVLLIFKFYQKEDVRILRIIVEKLPAPFKNVGAMILNILSKFV